MIFETLVNKKQKNRPNLKIRTAHVLIEIFLFIGSFVSRLLRTTCGWNLFTVVTGETVHFEFGRI